MERIIDSGEGGESCYSFKNWPKISKSRTARNYFIISDEAYEWNDKVFVWMTSTKWMIIMFFICLCCLYISLLCNMEVEYHGNCDSLFWVTYCQLLFFIWVQHISPSYQPSTLWLRFIVPNAIKYHYFLLKRLWSYLFYSECFVYKTKTHWKVKQELR